MWIYLNDAFVSVVEYQPAHWTHTDELLIRARVKGDIESALAELRVSDLVIEETSNFDYKYRTIISKATFAAVMTHQILGINYPNFKSSIPNSDPERYRAYTGVWQASIDGMDPDNSFASGFVSHHDSEECFFDD